MAYRLRKAASWAGEVAAEFLWPTRCAVCEMPGEKVLCDKCEQALLVIDDCFACPKCGAPYGITQCTECNATMLANAGISELPFERMSHSLVLDDAARSIVSIYKDQDERRLCSDIADTMVRWISPDLNREGYVITFVPDTKAALRRRGFDHSEEIAHAVSELSGLPCFSLFERPASTDQRALGRSARFHNMREKMRVKGGIRVPERVLLLDDVCTTGSTVYAACAALRGAGVLHVRVLTFAQVLA